MSIHPAPHNEDKGNEDNKNEDNDNKDNHKEYYDNEDKNNKDNDMSCLWSLSPISKDHLADLSRTLGLVWCMVDGLCKDEFHHVSKLLFKKS